ncbi:hypothetical protein SHIRM173S_03891 [Streptomyces hirsutus]
MTSPGFDIASHVVNPPGSLTQSFVRDLAAEATRASSRIRGLLTQFHPDLERALGPRLDHPAVTWLLEQYGSPASLRKAGCRRLVESELRIHGRTAESPCAGRPGLQGRPC